MHDSPAAQLKSPAQTLQSLRARLNATFSSATVHVSGKPVFGGSHNRVLIQLHSAADDAGGVTANKNVLMQIIGWGDIAFQGMSLDDDPERAANDSRTSFSWDRPLLHVQLEHEWTYGVVGEQGAGSCFWRITDDNARFAVTGACLIWDHSDTNFPKWFRR